MADQKPQQQKKERMTLSSDQPVPAIVEAVVEKIEAKI